jgi:hypothetical protein
VSTIARFRVSEPRDVSPDPNLVSRTRLQLDFRRMVRYRLSYWDSISASVSSGLSTVTTALPISGVRSTPGAVPSAPIGCLKCHVADLLLALSCARYRETYYCGNEVHFETPLREMQPNFGMLGLWSELLQIAECRIGPGGKAIGNKAGCISTPID